MGEKLNKLILSSLIASLSMLAEIGKTLFAKDPDMLEIVANYALNKEKSVYPKEMDPVILTRFKRYVLIYFNGHLFSIRNDYVFFDYNPHNQHLSRYYKTGHDFSIGIANMPHTYFQIGCETLEAFSESASILAVEKLAKEEAMLAELAKEEAMLAELKDDNEEFDDDNEEFDDEAFVGRAASNVASGRTASNVGRTSSNVHVGRTSSNVHVGRTISNA